MEYFEEWKRWREILVYRRASHLTFSLNFHLFLHLKVAIPTWSVYKTHWRKEEKQRREKRKTVTENHRWWQLLLWWGVPISSWAGNLCWSKMKCWDIWVRQYHPHGMLRKKARKKEMNASTINKRISKFQNWREVQLGWEGGGLGTQLERVTQSLLKIPSVSSGTHRSWHPLRPMNATRLSNTLPEAHLDLNEWGWFPVWGD